MMLLRIKYKVRDNRLRRGLAKSISPIWKAIGNAKREVVKGVCYMVGDGISIDVGMDSWVPSMDGLKPIPKDDSIAVKSLMVSSLVNPRTHNWKEDNLMDLFDTESIEAIKIISIPLMPR